MELFLNLCWLSLLLPAYLLWRQRTSSDRPAAGNGACTPHALAHSSQPILPSLASLTPEFEQIGTVLPFTPQSRRTFSASATAGGAPPFENPTSL
jgi:hypothetical protein